MVRGEYIDSWWQHPCWRAAIVNNARILLWSGYSPRAGVLCGVSNS